MLLRAAGATAEEAAASQAAAKEEGCSGTMDTDLNNHRPASSRFTYNNRSGSGSGNSRDQARSAQLAMMSVRARLILLRGACGTLQELDVLEEASGIRSISNKRQSAAGGDGGGAKQRMTLSGNAAGFGSRMGRGNCVAGVSGHEEMFDSPEGDGALRANLAVVCVSIVEEMTMPWGVVGGGDGCGAGEESDGKTSGVVDVMAKELERIIREEKVGFYLFFVDF